MRALMVDPLSLAPRMTPFVEDIFGAQKRRQADLQQAGPFIINAALCYEENSTSRTENNRGIPHLQIIDFKIDFESIFKVDFLLPP